MDFTKFVEELFWRGWGAILDGKSLTVQTVGVAVFFYREVRSKVEAKVTGLNQG